MVDSIVRKSEASLKYVKGSFYKLNLVASLVRGMSVKNAEAQLLFCKKRMSGDVLKVLKSAVANAVHNHSMDEGSLYINRVDVGKAFVMKRFMPRGRGRSTRIEKRFSNLRIILVEKNGMKI